MAKVFNTTGLCVPQKHYMVNIEGRLKEIKKLVDDGMYFAVNRARQYGKTTTLMALSEYLLEEYYVVFLDFQTFGKEEFETERIFSPAFASDFLKQLKRLNPTITDKLKEAVEAQDYPVIEII